MAGPLKGYNQLHNSINENRGESPRELRYFYKMLKKSVRWQSLSLQS